MSAWRRSQNRLSLETATTCRRLTADVEGVNRKGLSQHVAVQHEPAEDTRGASLIEASGGDLIVQASRFGSGASQIRLKPGPKTAVVMGNTMHGAIDIENTSQADVRILGNVTRH